MDRLKKSIAKLGKNSSQAFTLIELLIVIGILGVLAVTVLLTLNPAEAQRKARDVQRARDASNLQSIIEQALNDGLTPCSTSTATAPCQSSSIGGTGGGAGVTATQNQQQACGATTNWLGLDVCNYAKSVPADPLNGRTSFCYVSNAGGTVFTRTANCQMEYYLNTSGTDYEIDYKVESQSNAKKLFQDGGNALGQVEIFSALNTLVGPATNY